MVSIAFHQPNMVKQKSLKKLERLWKMYKKLIGSGRQMGRTKQRRKNPQHHLWIFYDF